MRNISVKSLALLEQGSQVTYKYYNASGFRLSVRHLSTFSIIFSETTRPFQLKFHIGTRLIKWGKEILHK